MQHNAESAGGTCWCLALLGYWYLLMSLFRLENSTGGWHKFQLFICAAACEVVALPQKGVPGRWVWLGMCVIRGCAAGV
jgi:hypothetical protein